MGSLRSMNSSSDSPTAYGTVTVIALTGNGECQGVILHRQPESQCEGSYFHRVWWAGVDCSPADLGYGRRRKRKSRRMASYCLGSWFHSLTCMAPGRT